MYNQNIKNSIAFIVLNLQKLLFFISFPITLFFKTPNRTLIIGNETANLLHLYANIFDCFSINTARNKFYSNEYNLDFSKYPSIFRIIFLPILFAIALRKFSSIWYFSSGSFFVPFKGRLWEFDKVKRSGSSLVCFFVGSDIRSLKLARNLSKELSLDHWSNYILKDMQNAVESSDKRSLEFSEAADNFSDHIFSVKNDQISYIKNKIHMLPTPVARNRFINNHSKWNDLSRIRILHSPSAFHIKGTQIVTAAIKKLEEEGYVFTFDLLTDVSQKEVLERLDNAHFALNEFYAYCPGIFGVEAMEANCLLLTSASKELEPDLFGEPNNVWVRTPYYEIYDNLKYFLDHPQEAINIANNGTNWAREYCSKDATYNYVKSIIE